MSLGNGNPKNGDKGSNFNYQLKMLKGLDAIATSLEAAATPGACEPGTGVCQIIAGENITISPETGLGVVTINADVPTSTLAGTDYIVVLAQGTPEENAAEFLAAYDIAVAADKNYYERFTLALAPGIYRFAETFNHDYDYIDITSLTGQQDVIFDLELNGQDPFTDFGGGVYETSPAMRVNVSSVTISNIITAIHDSMHFYDWTEGTFSNYHLPIAINLNSSVEAVFKNCAAGPFSFGANTGDNSINTEITCIDCISHEGFSFGYNMFYNYGSYTNCISYGPISWYSEYLAGEYINCTATQDSFVGVTDSYGYFVGCSALSFSFRAQNGQSDGYFKNCTAEDYSFNTNSFNQSEYINCKAGINSFQGNDGLAGSFRDCTGGSDSFRTEFGSIYGSLIRCTAAGASFYANSANNGSYYYCILFAGSFTGGTQYYCVD
jgi:hypothetical protein